MAGLSAVTLPNTPRPPPPPPWTSKTHLVNSKFFCWITCPVSVPFCLLEHNTSIFCFDLQPVTQPQTDLSVFEPFSTLFVCLPVELCSVQGDRRHPLLHHSPMQSSFAQLIGRYFYRILPQHGSPPSLMFRPDSLGFSMCLRGFTSDTPASSHSSETCTLG